MIDRNLTQKINDEHLKYLSSRIWAILKYRLKEYQDRLQEYNRQHIKNEEWSTVARTQGLIDGVAESIRLTEGLGRDISDGTFDVDAALHVIEKKVE